MVVGENDFEISIPLFLSLHPIFNMELLCPYFPPLLDTLEVVERLDQIELNSHYIEKAKFDQILGTKLKDTC